MAQLRQKAQSLQNSWKTSLVSRDAKAFWQWKYQKKVHLDKLTTIGWELHDEFRSTIKAVHPWLHLCEGHWKADQIWINNFSKWMPAEQ